MKLGVVGSGSIASFHIDALVNAGFTPSIIGTRPGSERTHQIGAKHGFAQIAQSWHDVIDSNVDAYLIATKTSVTQEILKVAIDTGRPILVEKPVSFSSIELAALGDPGNVLVGYNRRHYSSTLRAKELVDENPVVSFNASIPESSWTTTMSPEMKVATILGNSVHVLDLLQYLFGELTINGIARLNNQTGLITRSVTLSNADTAGQVLITFGSPSNYYLDIHTPGKSALMRPIEFFQEYVSLSVVEPTREMPLRHYVPKRGEEFKLSRADLDFKPGLLSQALELGALVNGNLGNRKSATLADAVSVLKLAEAIVG